MARDRMSSDVGISWCRCSSSHCEREFKTQAHLRPGRPQDLAKPSPLWSVLGRGAGCRLAANIAEPEWTPSPEQALSETPQALQGVCRPPRSHLSPRSGRRPAVRPRAWGTWGRTRRQGLLRAGPAAAGLAWGPLAHTGLSQEAGLALGRPHKTRQSGSKDSSGDPEACPGTHRLRQAGAEPWGPPAGVEGPCPTHLLQLVPQAVFCDTQGPHASRPTRRLQLL